MWCTGSSTSSSSYGVGGGGGELIVTDGPGPAVLNLKARWCGPPLAALFRRGAGTRPLSSQKGGGSSRRPGSFSVGSKSGPGEGGLLGRNDGGPSLKARARGAGVEEEDDDEVSEAMKQGPKIEALVSGNSDVPGRVFRRVLPIVPSIDLVRWQTGQEVSLAVDFSSPRQHRQQSPEHQGGGGGRGGGAGGGGGVMGWWTRAMGKAGVTAKERTMASRGPTTAAAAGVSADVAQVTHPGLLRVQVRLG